MTKLDCAELLIKSVGDCRYLNCGNCFFTVDKKSCLSVFKRNQLNITLTEFRDLKIKMAKDYIEEQKKLNFLENL